ncbi:MAG: ABC transporter ATP-binding protein [Candidatus Omnitrophica bacterium 4484_49]|nr:ABC transporter ATP-binding protein [Candidatus Omnitrophota bacterium]OQX83858.1 MAG: ABC transporter ATP-binding protein [Candidatus Omnitrophica bacterium 4484_49]
MIKVIDLWKKFGDLEVLTGVNIEVMEGETFVIIGQSGTGKSVFLKLLIGLLKPDRGKIYIQGRDITELSERELSKLRIEFGMVFQYAALFDSLNVFENVAFGLTEHTDLDEEHITQRVKECLKLVGLDGIEDKMPAELSGGMKKRVAIARAIALNPKIILYDEPTAGLDPVVASSINKLIKELKEKTQATSVVVTHDMKSAYEVGDRIGMLYQGKLIEVGNPDQIRNTQNPVVRQFINGEFEGPITVS